MNEDKPSIPLKEYIEKMMDERDKRYEDRFQAQEKALQIALLAKQETRKDTQWSIETIVAIVLGLLALAVSFFWKH